jgi:hypothetical protein
VSSPDTTHIAQTMRSTGMITSMSLRLTRALGAVLVLSLLAVPSAAAAPGWLAPTSFVEETGSVGQPRIAVDGQGDAIAVWQSEDGKLEGGVSSYEVRTAFRPAGGAWQIPERLSPYGQSAEEANVAFDAHGDAFAVWDAYSSNVPEGDAHFSVQAAFRPAGGAWQTPVDLSPVEAPGGVHPSLAVDAQGSAMVTWNRGAGPVQEAFRPAGGAWQAPVDLTQGNAEGDFSQVAFDKHGDALAMWQGDGLQSAFMPDGGTWQPPSIVGSELVAGSDFAVDGRGDSVAVWDSWTEGFLSHRVVQAALRPAGGEWQTPVDLSEGLDGEDWRWEPYEPRVAIDEQGDAVVVWARGEGETQAASKPSGGAWQTPVDLSLPGTSDGDAQVAFDGQGNALAVWDGEDGTVQSAFKPAGGEWQAPVDIGHGGGPQVAFDERGDALAAWVGTDGIQTAGYVATGPVLNDVSIPATGTVGQPLTFSVSPFDVWSVLGETSWSFGDGSSGSGASVTHTYTAPGTYEVTLRSADTLGNVASSMGKITISAEAKVSTPESPTSQSSTPGASSRLGPSLPPKIEAATESAIRSRENGKSRAGTVFRVSLNEQATVTLSFVRDVGCRTQDRRVCVVKATGAAAKAHHFTAKTSGRTVEAGSFSFAGHAGMNSIDFNGRTGHEPKLTPGRYTLIIAATNAAGQGSGATALRFAILN